MAEATKALIACAVALIGVAILSEILKEYEISQYNRAVK